MFRLMLDRRVPLSTKLIPVVALIYLVSPFDIVHDMIPVLGRIDDLLAIVLGALVFLVAAPYDVVVEHIRGRRADDDPRAEPPDSDGSVIDGKYRYVGRRLRRQAQVNQHYLSLDVRRGPGAVVGYVDVYLRAHPELGDVYAGLDGDGDARH